MHNITFNGIADTLDLSNIKPGIDCLQIYRKYFEVDNKHSGTNGRLVIKGAGSDRTVLVSDNFHNTISGYNVNRLTISDMHFTRYEVSLQFQK